MPLARLSYVGDGSTTIFGVTFDYLYKETVTVTVDGVPTAINSWPTDATIEITPAPAVSAAIVVQRTTPISTPIHDFTDGANLGEDALDMAFLQNLLVNQEISDRMDDLEALVASLHP